MMKNVFNVPSSAAFVDVVAQRFLDEYSAAPLSLSEVLFLLPNRRACQNLKEAFVRAQGLKPTLLPQMMPLGDVEEDELFVSGFDFSEELKNLPAAVPSFRRLLWFTKQIMQEAPSFGLDKFSAQQACSLAQSLCQLIDDVHNEQLSFDNLKNLVPEEYAQHWLDTLRFLEIVTQRWPAYLKENNLVDPAERRNILLDLQCRFWQKHPPSKRIVVAGTTATYPMMRRLVKTVLDLPNGELVLYGVDKNLDTQSYDKLDESHPQFEIKQLLDFIEVNRFEVVDFCSVVNPQREKMVSEFMRPASTTDKWRGLATEKIMPQAAQGLSVIDCPDLRQEAVAVSLLMRAVLEKPEKTAALVTTDRNLARRVAAELERWDVKVDDSAGKPLSLSPVGAFLRLIIQACLEDFAPVPLLALMKHPFFANGEDYSTVRRKVRDFEKLVLRADEPSENPDIVGIFDSLKQQLEPLRDLLASADNLKNLLESHILAAEKLASTPEKNGAAVLWRGDDGESAAGFLSSLYDEAAMLDKLNGNEYLDLLESLMVGVTVRPRYGTHPRLKILGPIEARLCHFDLLIIGEVNEGAWPKAADADPWMSRPMKKSFGLPLPEKAVGILAKDFADFLCGENVVLTRAAKVQSTPMSYSRWWMRLQTVLAALGSSIENLYAFEYLTLGELLDKPSAPVPFFPPAPKPPLDARPRKLSASTVEVLMRDPYQIFARHILKLYPLNDLNRELDFSDYGTLVHKVLEVFNRRYPTEYPNNAEEILLKLGEEYFAENEVDLEKRAFWWPSFVKSVQWLVQTESEYRKDIARIHCEVSGSIVFKAAGGDFEITAKADRIDETKDGQYIILDYKTGSARSTNEIIKGYAPQLPIEGLIASNGGFNGLAPKKTAGLVYWQLGKKETFLSKNIDDVLKKNQENLLVLINTFDKPDTPYYCQPNPSYAPKYSDYLNLARVQEWKVKGDADDE